MHDRTYTFQCRCGKRHVLKHESVSKLWADRPTGDAPKAAWRRLIYT